MTAEIVYGKVIAQHIKKNISEELKSLQNKYAVQPTIVTIAIGTNASSDVYLRLRDKACNEVGIHSKHIFFDELATEENVLSVIHELNQNNEVHGIFIQYPVPKHVSQYRLMSSVHPIKDVEGLHPYNIGQILLGNEEIIPCTPRAVLELLAYHKIPLQGKNIVIINHSAIVGKPLSLLLLNRNATVSICHVYTKQISDITQNADILISAVGKPNIVTANMVRKDSIVIDIGIVETPAGLRGDVDFEHVLEKVRMITPVPGGIGPLTVACSLQNILFTFRQCMQKS